MSGQIRDAQRGNKCVELLCGRLSGASTDIFDALLGDPGTLGELGMFETFLFDCVVQRSAFSRHGGRV